MNADIVRFLREMSRLRGEDTQAGIAYYRAAKSIESLGYNIRLREKPVATLGIKNVGTKIGATIDEYIATGTFTGAEELRQRAAVRDIFTGIIGVGPVTAETWYDAGLRNLDDLRREIGASRITLTAAQALGLRYYDDLNSRIPRDELTEITASIRAGFMKLTNDNKTVVEPVGSYRRGAPNSGDADMIIMRQIRRPRLLLDFAATLDPSHIISSGPERLSFVHRERDRWRQVDLLLVSASVFAAAMLYFTGSWEFNVAMRGIAKNKGFRLNQNGLFRVRQGTVSKTPLVTPTEESIFRALGLEYVEPYERDAPPKEWVTVR